MKFERIENVDCIIKENNSKKAVLVLHGYGASFKDLAPLYSYLDDDESYDWYFLDGHLGVDVGMGMQGRAWFPIDMQKLQSAMMTGQFSEVFKTSKPEGIDVAIRNVSSVIEKIKSRYEDGIYIGGFSQGSMVSLGVALENFTVIKKIFLLSSTLFDQNTIDKEIVNISQIPLFQSHGRSDAVLPFKMAKELSTILEKNQSDYKFVEFNGGHEIPLNVIGELKSFLRK